MIFKILDTVCPSFLASYLKSSQHIIQSRESMMCRCVKKKMTQFALVLSVSLSLGFTLGGCQSNSIDTTPNVLPGADLNPQGGEMNGGEMNGGEMNGGMDEPSTCRTCVQEGTFYRFTELALTSLDQNESHPVIGTLNSLWAGDIDNHQLNVLFEIKAVTEDQIQVAALNAAWNGEGENDYCLLENTSIDFAFQRSECGFSNQDSAGINIFAGSQEYPKNCALTDESPNTIPVRDVLLQGAFNESCSEIISGTVPSAVIAQSALEQTCTCLIGPMSPLSACKGLDPAYTGDDDGACGGCNDSYRSLNSLLSAFGALNYECETGGNPAVCIEAQYSAVRLDFTPDVCP